MGKAKKKSAKTSVFGDRNKSGMVNIRPTYKGSPPKKKAAKKK